VFAKEVGYGSDPSILGGSPTVNMNGSKLKKRAVRTARFSGSLREFF